VPELDLRSDKGEGLGLHCQFRIFVASGQMQICRYPLNA